jgi:serine/threonine-protein kinase
MAELPATISATLANSQEGAPFLEDGRPAGQPVLDEGGRYTDQRLIGVGGMGEVRLVYDGVLKRTAVLKTVRSELAPEVWDRLIAEAGLTAGLQHPGVVPVYDAGRLTDGRPFYVMREVRGFTLAELIEAVHKVSVEAGRWSNTRDGWTLRGLIGVVASVAATISYAHRQGWVHRDIKPANIMVEGPGAVVVVDWGIAQRAAFAALGDGSSGERAVTGSPGFMSPEQLRGMPPWPSFDVFALGATLQAVLVGGTPNPSRSPPFPVADALQAVASAAMAPDPAVRTPSAERVASSLRAWLDGVLRRDQAMARVEEADRALQEVAGWRAQAATSEAEAVALGAGIALWESVDKKLPMWRAEDAAERLRAAIAGAEERAAQLLHAALSVDPELDVAHERLADLHRVQHEAAEHRGDGLGRRCGPTTAASTAPTSKAAGTSACGWSRPTPACCCTGSSAPRSGASSPGPSPCWRPARGGWSRRWPMAASSSRPRTPTAPPCASPSCCAAAKRAPPPSTRGSMCCPCPAARAWAPTTASFRRAGARWATTPTPSIR